MPIPRLTLWFAQAFNEAMVPALGQAGDFTVQKAVDSVMKNGREFGEANDSVRLGIISVLFVALVLLAVYVAFRVILAQNKVIVDDLRLQINTLKEEKATLEGRLDKERDTHLKDTDAHRAVMIQAITEFNQGRENLKETLRQVQKSQNNMSDDLARTLRQPLPVRVEMAFPAKSRRVPREIQELHEEDPPFQEGDIQT